MHALSKATAFLSSPFLTTIQLVLFPDFPQNSGFLPPGRDGKS
jgi:hypothetical protein